MTPDQFKQLMDILESIKTTLVIISCVAGLIAGIAFAK